ncbi:MAG: nuclear transport factor 2 family protein [Betaproteobacteria bacterium]
MPDPKLAVSRATMPAAPESRGFEDETFFEALERRRTHALVQQDMQVIEELHAPEYELVTPSGRVFTREKYIETIARESFYAGWELGEMNFRISADMAIVRYKARLRFPSGGELLCWHTDTYEKRSGRWRAVWSQATELREPVPLP